MQFLKPVRDYVGTLMHPSAQRDALVLARHRAFIGPRLIGSSAALAAFALYRALRGLPSALEIVVFAWLIAPILAAYFLSRTGRHEGAHVISALSASLYATGIALGAESLSRTSLGLRYAEEDRSRLLTRNMTDVITRHGRNGIVLFASPAAERLLGAPVAELLGHGRFDRVHVADRPAYRIALAGARGEGRSVEFRVWRDLIAPAVPRGPRHLWIEMRCPPLDCASVKDGAAPDDRNGATLDGEVVAVMREVSDRTAQQRALDDARSEAEQANVARFLATMSHEPRTPLNAGIGFSERLMNETEIRLDLGRRREYATLIRESGTHLFGVVNGILDMIKIDAGDFEIRPEPVRRAGVIGGCCDLLALRARETGLQVIDVAPEPPEIVAEKRALKQIPNKFSNRGGPITVRATVEGNRIALAVEDNGIGIREGTCRASATRSSRRAAATTGVRTQPGSATRSSRAWWRCTVGMSRSVAGSAKGRASRCASRSIASRRAPPLHHPNIAQRPPAEVGPAASNTTRMVRQSA